MKIEWKTGGFEDLLSAADISAILTDEAKALADRANSFGAGHFEMQEAKFRPGRRRAGRARAWVRTGDLKAIKAEAEQHVLLKALGGGGRVQYTSKAGRVSYITQAQYDNYTRGQR